MSSEPSRPAPVDGDCDTAFAAVRDAFAAELRRRPRARRVALGQRRRSQRRRPLGRAPRRGPTRGRGNATASSACSRAPKASLRSRRCGRSPAGLVDLDAPVARVLARVRGRRQGRRSRCAGCSPTRPACPRSGPHAARFAQRLGRDDHRARRAGAVVGAGHRARLPRRHVRPPDRRGAAARDRARLRRADPRRAGVARSASSCACRCRPHSTRAPADLVVDMSTEGTFFDRWDPKTSLGPEAFGNPPDCNDPAHCMTETFRRAVIPAANMHANARRSTGSTRARAVAGWPSERARAGVAGRGVRARARPRRRPGDGAPDRVRARLRAHDPRVALRSRRRARTATTAAADRSASSIPTRGCRSATR